MAATIRIRCTRAMLFRGERIEAGAVLELDPLQAAAAIDSGRAEYVDRADIERAAAAITEQRDRQLDALNRAEQQAAAMWTLRRRQRA